MNSNQKSISGYIISHRSEYIVSFAVNKNDDLGDENKDKSKNGEVREKVRIQQPNTDRHSPKFESKYCSEVEFKEKGLIKAIMDSTPRNRVINKMQEASNEKVTKHKKKNSMISNQIQPNTEREAVVKDRSSSLIPPKNHDDLPLSGILMDDGEKRSGSEISQNDIINRMINNNQNSQRDQDEVDDNMPKVKDGAINVDMMDYKNIEQKYTIFGKSVSLNKKRKNQIHGVGSARLKSKNAKYNRSKSSFKDGDSAMSERMKNPINCDSMAFEDKDNYRLYHSKLKYQLSRNNSSMNIFKKLAGISPEFRTTPLSVQSHSRKDKRPNKEIDDDLNGGDYLNPKVPSTFKQKKDENSSNNTLKINKSMGKNQKLHTVNSYTIQDNRYQYQKSATHKSHQNAHEHLKSQLPSERDISILNEGGQKIHKDTNGALDERKMSAFQHSLTNGIPTATFLSHKNTHTIWTFGNSRSRQESDKQNQKSEIENPSIIKTNKIASIQFDDDVQNILTGSYSKKIETYTPKYNRLKEMSRGLGFQSLLNRKDSDLNRFQIRPEKADSVSFQEDQEGKEVKGSSYFNKDSNSLNTRMIVDPHLITENNKADILNRDTISLPFKLENE